MSAPITKSLTCAPAVTGLKTRALHGVDCVVSDDYADPKRAVVERLPEVVWQRSYVHFLRNAPDSLPRKADDDCRQALRWLYDRRSHRFKVSRSSGSNWKPLVVCMHQTVPGFTE